jgi:hypothetical protein
MNSKFQTIQAVGRAVYAYRTNGNRIEKYASVNPQTSVKTLSNKELMLETEIVSAEDLAEAEELVNYLQQTQMLQSLTGGRVNSFLDKVVAIVCVGEVDRRDFGMVAWVPKLSDDLKKRDEITHTSKLHEHKSKHVGAIGDKLQLNFTIIDTRYISSMDCYMVYGHGDDENLYNYWANSKERIFSGKIAGKVKRHDIDTYHGHAKVTQLNYVKVAK